MGTAAFAGLPMSIINCCLIVFDDGSSTDRMVLRTIPLLHETRQALN
jgi:hypothetical protein